MKRQYSIWYFIAQSFKGLWRNGVMSVASIAVLMSCLVVIGGFALLVLNINVNLEHFGLLNEIVVFVGQDATEEEIVAVEEKIRALDNVDTVTRTTKAQALEEMKNESSDYAGIYDDITEENNPLSDSFTVTYLDADKVANLDYQLTQIDGIRKVNNRLDLAVSLNNFKHGVMLVFGWFLVILFVVSVFVIINTIKLAVFSRRHEISVMRYVGATNWFIVLPFIFEGMIIGLFSGAFAYLIEWYAYRYIERVVIGDLSMITLVGFSEINMYLLAGFLIVGVVTGIIGSCISLSKYLKS